MTDLFGTITTRSERTTRSKMRNIRRQSRDLIELSLLSGGVGYST